MCALLLLPSACQALADELTVAQMRQEDTRLERTVTIRAQRMQVGELLERIAAASGAGISADPNHAGSADDVVLVSFHEVRIADAMDALWGLLSYRDARWRWDRSGSPGSYAYALARPSAARALPEALRAEQEQRFVDEATARFQAAAGLLTDDELRGRLEKALGTGNLAIRDGYPMSPRARGALGAAARALTGEQIAGVISGEQMQTIPLSALGERDRAFVDQYFANGKYHSSDDGGRTKVPIPEPDAACICRQETSSGPPYIAFGLKGLDLTGFCGGSPIQRAMARTLGNRWMLPGDAARSDREGAGIARLVASDSRPDTGAERLLVAADLAGVPLLMRYPMPDGPDSRQVAGATLRQVLDRLEDDPAYYAHKWRAGVLLVQWIPWYQHEAHTVPWKLVRQARAECSAQQGYLTVDALLKLAAEIRPDQVKWNPWLIPASRALSEVHEPAAAMHRNRRGLRTETGCVADPDLTRVMAGLMAGRLAVGEGSPLRVRLIRDSRYDTAVSGRCYTAQIRAGAGVWLNVVSLGIQAWKPEVEWPRVTITP